MSVYAAFCYPDRIEMLTDGALYTPDGVFRGHTHKVRKTTDVPAVITTRGYHSFGRECETVIDRAFDKTKSFDGGVSLIKEILPRLRRYENHPLGVEMCIAGISESNGPMACFWCTEDDWADGAKLQAFTLYETKRGVVGGSIISARHHDSILEQVPTFAGEHGIRFVNGLRSDRAQTPHGSMEYFIGGHLDHTTVTRDGVETKTIHTWNDRIGEKINPLADPTNVVPMNRQQRRAARKIA
jgi:hypothetical protein